ncbi:MAG: hypothetical protein WDO71_12670 [Bacteroidota bacterium]
MAEFSYNDKWLLSHAMYIYPAGYIPQAWDYTTIDIEYDAQKVVQKITVRYGDGSSEIKVYNKIPLPGGNYQLSWDESDPGSPMTRFCAGLYLMLMETILPALLITLISLKQPRRAMIFIQML